LIQYCFQKQQDALSAQLLQCHIEKLMTSLNAIFERITFNRRFATALLILSLSVLASCASSPSQVVWLDVRTDAGLEKDAEIKVYCRSGKRAGIALATLQELGYTNATNVGGISDARGLKD
jgi:hypothetical protein